MAVGQVLGGEQLEAWFAKVRAASAGALRSVEVGFFESAKYDDGTPVAYIAAIQEFGTEDGHIPERPYFRQAISRAEDELPTLLADLADDDTATIPQVAGDLIGLRVQNLIQERIAQLQEPELAESTVKRKGSDKPLIDTGTLQTAVTFHVNAGGSDS